MQMRSVMSSRCGELKRPVRSPIERRIASIMMAVLPLPFVPVTAMTGQASCGSPSSSHSAPMRANEGPTRCSGHREVIDATVRACSDEGSLCSRVLLIGPQTSCPTPRGPPG